MAKTHVLTWLTGALLITTIATLAVWAAVASGDAPAPSMVVSGAGERTVESGQKDENHPRSNPIVTDPPRRNGSQGARIAAVMGATMTNPPVVDIDVPKFRDDALLQVYSDIEASLERLEQQDDTVPPRYLPKHRDALAVTRATRKLVEQQRFWFYGSKEVKPSYSHLQTRNTRFWSRFVGDYAVVLEMTRAEFPEVFENDPRVFGGKGK